MGKHVLSNVEGFDRRGGEIFFVDPRSINVVNGWNHRTDFTGEEELMNSIIANGVRVPLLVKKTQDGTLSLADGERRLRATLRAISEGNPIKSVPVEVAKRGTNDIDLYLESFVRNDSKPPTPTEEATAFKRLVDWGLSVKEVAQKVGRSESHVRNRLELSNAAPEVKKAVESGEITVRAAQDIAKKSEGSIDSQTAALQEEKEKPSPRKAPKPLTMFVKSGEVKQKGGRKDDECRPLVEFFTSKELRDKIRETGFDPDTLKVTVSRINDATIAKAEMQSNVE